MPVLIVHISTVFSEHINPGFTYKALIAFCVDHSRNQNEIARRSGMTVVPKPSGDKDFLSNV